MKTNADLMKFFGVEEGKEYIVVKQFYDQGFKINYKLGSHFIIKKDAKDNRCVLFEDGTNNHLIVLQTLDYTVFNNPLTDEERQFLKNVIKPLSKYCQIQIRKRVLTDYEWLEINFVSEIDSGNLTLPMYPAGKYYKGLEFDRYYIPYELGLTKFVKEPEE